MKRYMLLQIMLLLVLGAHCSPSLDKFPHSLLQHSATEIKNEKHLRIRRSLDNDSYSNSITSGSNVFVVCKEDIPEKDRRPVLTAKNHATHQIYYLPIAANNLNPKDLEIIKSTLVLGRWMKDFAPAVDYSFLHYQESRNLDKGSFRTVKAPIDEPIELNFEDLNNPFVTIHKRNGCIIRSGEVFRDLMHINSFSSKWDLHDWDIEFANDIRGLSSPIKSGDKVHLLFIQMIQYEKAKSSRVHYYLNPINLDSLDLISYTVK